ncbi:geobacillin-26 family protein [Clostridium hydrogenum]|uniref:geobacillin-26 family protein n=1 Tax=Clostridium hydrogenum TaxID=2855764 RepID=UPI001F19EA31|nr:geobacillin-26 family protein [Clostridium hydrogenum]
MKTKFLKKLSLALMLSFSAVIVGQSFTVNAAVKNQTQTSIIQSKTIEQSSITCNNQNISVTVVEDNANFKEVKVTNGNKISIVKYDKNANTAVLNGNTKVDFNKKNQIHTNSYVADSTTDLTKIYSYTALTYGGWWMVNAEDGYKCVKETTVNPDTNEANSVPLQAFRTSVNNLKGYEIAAAAAYGTATISIIAGIINTPETLGVSDIVAIVVAAGALLSEVPILYNVYTSKKDCNFYFNRIRTLKTNNL